MATGIQERTYVASIEDEIYNSALSNVNLDVISNHIKFNLSEEDSIIISNCDILKKYENILLDRCINVQISEDFYYRPEKISLRLYNTTDLWYTILFLNGLETQDKLDMPVIRALNPDSVNIFLEILSTEKHNINNRFKPEEGQDLQVKKLTDKSNAIIKKVFKRYKPVKHPEYVIPAIRKVYSHTLCSKMPNDLYKTVIRKIIDKNLVCLKANQNMNNVLLKTELKLTGPFPNTLKPLFVGSCKVMYKGDIVLQIDDNSSEIEAAVDKVVSGGVIKEKSVIRKDMVVKLEFTGNSTGKADIEITDSSNRVTTYTYEYENCSVAYVPVIFNSGIYNDDNTGIKSVKITTSQTCNKHYGYYTFKEVVLPIKSYTSYEDVIFSYTPSERLHYSFFNCYISYNFKKFEPINDQYYHKLTESNNIGTEYSKKIILTDMSEISHKYTDDIAFSADLSIDNYNTTDCVGIFFKRDRSQYDIGIGGLTKEQDVYYMYCLGVKDFKTDQIQGALNGLYKISIDSTDVYKITRPGDTLIKIDPNSDFYLVGKKLASTPQYLTGNTYPTNIRISTEGPLITVYDETNKPIIEYRDYSPIKEESVKVKTKEELDYMAENNVFKLRYGIIEFTDKSFTETNSNIKVSNIIVNALGYEDMKEASN